MSDEMVVQKLRELLAKATPGPWYVSTSGATIRAVRRLVREGCEPTVVNTRICFGYDGSSDQRRNDWGLITEARNVLPALLDEIERHRASAALRDGGGVEARGPAWSDCKVAFDLEDPDVLWTADKEGELRLPLGWELNETDSAGARWVCVFRIEGLPTAADGDAVLRELMRIKALPASYAEHLSKPAALCDGGEVEAKLTPEYLAMTPLQKWETLALNGLLGTDEPWIEDMRQSLRALSVPDGYARGICDAAAYLERRADEMGDSITAQAVARIFRDEAEAMRSLTPKGPTT